MVVTGDIGTETTLCRALLEEIDRNTFSALVLNPFLSEEDLLKLILQDFGVVSREDVKRGRLTHVSKQELIETIYDFLLSLLPIHASALLIIDEAQNLLMPVLEQIRILSNLETDKEKLLQIVLVGQLNPAAAPESAADAAARSARLHQISTSPLEPRRGCCLCVASLDRCRRLGSRHVPAQGDRYGVSPHERHSPARQPRLRARAAGSLLGPVQSRVARDRVPGGGNSSWSMKIRRSLAGSSSRVGLWPPPGRASRSRLPAASLRCGRRRSRKARAVAVAPEIGIVAVERAPAPVAVAPTVEGVAPVATAGTSGPVSTQC